MVAFLLAWNPRRAQWQERHNLQKRLQLGKHAVTQWGMMSKSVEPGDRLFFIRLGVPPKGIFAIGSAVTSSYLSPHWNETKRLAGKKARCVDVALVEYLDPDRQPVLGVEQLVECPFNEMHWSIQGSGVMIPGHVADALDSLWQTHYRALDCETNA